MILSQLHVLANHLWQSTLFAAAAGLLTLALRKNRAQTRYCVWLVASVKFLIPFALLVDVGSHFGQYAAPAISPPGLSYVFERASEPFTVPPPLAATQMANETSSMNWIPAVVCAFWVIGSATLIFSWWRRWRGLRAALRTASPLDLNIGMKAMISPAFAEPGVFGVRRPVLLLPAGISDCLTPQQLNAIVAHELCHVRRRDNLATAIHMGVEALFWFHPLVWWLGARLMEERERACDEEVLLMGSEPQAYAEGILRICEMYLESPLPCVSGVTGANLRKRIEEIMSHRIGIRLSVAKRAIFTVAGIFALAAPIIVGVMSAPSSRAQTASSATLKFEVASVKPSKDCGAPGAAAGGRRGGGVSPSPGRLHVCGTVEDLIQNAYVVYADGHTNRRLQARASGPPLSGGPAWIRSDRYLIDAKPERAAGQEMMNGPMMQALLQERFRLKIRRETREVPAYALTAARGATKLHQFQDGSCVLVDLTKHPTPPPPPGQKNCLNGVFTKGKGQNIVFQAQGTSLERFSTLIGWAVGRPVFDKTGIPGLFDFHLEFALDEATPTLTDPASAPATPSDEPAGPSLFGAIQQQLGLKLEPARGPKEFLVIDHVERPSGN